jgi:glutathione peroxidase
MNIKLIASILFTTILSPALAVTVASAAEQTELSQSARLPAAELRSAPSPAKASECPGYLDHEFRKLHSSKSVNLCTEYAGKPLLIINTASFCGFTPQFKGLEALYKKYKGRGLVVVGFPSDDFRQEADKEAETAKVCYLNYGVTFPMLAPISVKGANAHPLFKELARQSAAPRWNFNKYLVGPSGEVVKHFGPSTTPASPILIESIEKVL